MTHPSFDTKPILCLYQAVLFFCCRRFPHLLDERHWPSCTHVLFRETQAVSIGRAVKCLQRAFPPSLEQRRSFAPCCALCIAFMPIPYGRATRVQINSSRPLSSNLSDLVVFHLALFIGPCLIERRTGKVDVAPGQGQQAGRGAEQAGPGVQAPHAAGL